jgi:hypothetical protein
MEMYSELMCINARLVRLLVVVNYLTTKCEHLLFLSLLDQQQARKSSQNFQ